MNNAQKSVAIVCAMVIAGAVISGLAGAIGAAVACFLANAYGAFNE